MKIKHTINRNEELWRSTKKLGSLLGDTDIARRKQLAIVQAKLDKLWIKGRYISEKLDASLVKPILIYNAGTWGISETDEKNLNSFHRRQLLNMKYPATISNVNLYKRTRDVEIVLSNPSTSS